MVLVGIKLIFFTVADTLLWFLLFYYENNADNRPVFSVDAEQCLHLVKDYSVSCATLSAKSKVYTRSWEGTQPGQLT